MNNKENTNNNIHSKSEEVNKEPKTNTDNKDDIHKNNKNDTQNKNNNVQNNEKIKLSKTLSQTKLKEVKFKELINTKVFKFLSYMLVFILGGLVLNFDETPIMTNDEIETMQSESTSYKEQLDTANENLTKANAEIDKLNEKIESAQPWFEMEENEQEEIEKANEEKRKAKEEEAKRKEEEEQRAKEEEEKKGYDTGITYSQLARNPDDCKYKKVKFEGKVIQVMEGDGETQIRLAVNGSYDNILYGIYKSDIVDSRVLEDDYITIYGNSAGLITYTSTMGGEITIPSVVITKISQ